jgi:hypothetical protein
MMVNLRIHLVMRIIHILYEYVENHNVVESRAVEPHDGGWNTGGLWVVVSCVK